MHRREPTRRGEDLIISRRNANIRGDAIIRLAAAILRNPYLNGGTIRLDGAIRMAPR